MHEIVTVQVGNQSNFLGTHFWNAQESYFTYGGEEESLVDHDVHFRPGVAADGSDTYTPRTLIYDHRSSFGTLRQVNTLYEISEEQNQRQPQSLWTRGTSVQRQRLIEPHPYQRSLDAGVEPAPLSKETVRYWSDFNRVYYHPRSLIQLDDPIITQGSQLSSWEKFDTGLDVFDSLDKEHDLLDRDLRPFVEEADHLQGLSLVTCVDDAWGGFASAYAERVEDEYGRVPRWIWCLEDTRSPLVDRRGQLLLNRTRSLLSLTNSGSLYLPLTNTPSTSRPSYLDFDIESQWHTSALQMAAMESTTLPSRLRTDNSAHATMADLEDVFTTENSNRKILYSEYSVKSSSSSSGSGFSNGFVNGHSNGVAADAMDLDAPEEPEALDISLSPSIHDITSERSTKDRYHTFSRIDVLRGSWAVAKPRDPFSASALNTKSYEIRHLFPLPSSYPTVFHFPQQIRGEGLGVHARMSSTSNVAYRLRENARMVGRAVGVQGREEVYSDLRRLADEYVEGWDEDSDTGDDD